MLALQGVRKKRLLSGRFLWLSVLSVTLLLETLDDVDWFAFERRQSVKSWWMPMPKFRDLVFHYRELAFSANVKDE